MPELPIVYEDGDVAVFDKPSGLAVQGGEGVGTCLIDAARDALSLEPYLVHRLDKETSGLIVVAKGKEAAAAFSDLIATRAVRKVYAAVCSGSPSPASGRISAPVPVRGEPKSALTLYRTLASCPGYSLLDLELGTGRTHQLRLHLAGAGCPILGDDRHGDFKLNRALKKEKGLKRLLLHARFLSLPLPSGRRVDLRSALPERFAPFLEELGVGSDLPFPLAFD